MENTNEVVTETVKTEVETEPQKIERTFTRAEFNNAIAGERKRIREEILAEVEAQKSEAEKLASMKESEKQQYALDKASKERDDAMAKLNAYQLREEAEKIAEEKGVNPKLLSLIDFTRVKAEDVESHIDSINNIVSSEVERLVNEKLKEPTPRTVLETGNNIRQVSRASY